MSNVQPYVFPATGQQVRTIVIDGEFWFVLRDSLDVLGVANVTDAVQSLDEDEFDTAEVVDSAGRRQSSYIVSESGLYSLILRSRKPEAKAFKRWVTHEVLPAIRKTGGYNVAASDLADPVKVQVAVNALAELAHDEHVVPAAARILAFKRWRKPRKGIEVYVQLAIDVGSLGLDGTPVEVKALPAKERAR